MSSDHTGVLKQISLFKDVQEEDLQKVLNICLRQTFQKGHTLFREGDQAHGSYILISGKVKIFKLSPDGKEYTMRIIRPGESFAQVPPKLEATSTSRLPTMMTLIFSEAIFRFNRLGE